jgi:mono/diheme cytochrome c family protein
VRQLLLVVIAAVVLAGCEQKMADMPKRDPLDPSPLFADGASARPQVPGTIAVDEIDVASQQAAPRDLATLQHGQERYGIFCSPCHAYDGRGGGRVVQRGFPHPPDLHAPAIASLADRQIFDVITDGYGAMYPYGSRVPAVDRWAIVAYIRALQYADHVPATELTPSLRERLP